VRRQRSRRADAHAATARDCSLSIGHQPGNGVANAFRRLFGVAMRCRQRSAPSASSTTASVLVPPRSTPSRSEACGCAANAVTAIPRSIRARRC
jgi:hypothetical protein